MGTADLGNALNGLYGGDFDYTFTEAELHDVLGYMEAQQSGGLVEPLPFYSTALQFQPHNPSSQPVGTAESLVPLKPELFDVVDLGPMPPCPPVASALVPSAIATPPQQQQLNGGTYQHQQQQQQQQQGLLHHFDPDFLVEVLLFHRPRIGIANGGRAYRGTTLHPYRD